MSKILFITLMATSSLTVKAYGASDIPCDDAVMAVDHWSVQLHQDENGVASRKECMKNLTLAKQSFPELKATCAKFKFSELLHETQRYWLNRALSEHAKPRPAQMLGKFTTEFRTETLSSVTRSCDRLKHP